jgi:aldose 1-epimerase
MASKRFYGKTADGREAYLYRIENQKGSYAEISDFGAMLVSFAVPDKSGKPVDIVLGHDTLESVQNKGGFTGATIGRVINRIAKGELWIDTRKVQLETQWENMTFHGGAQSYARQLFTAEFDSGAEGETVRFYHRDRSDSGFPGSMDVFVAFTLTDDDTLILRYKAYPEADTHINISNHAYFNVAGQGNGTVRGHILEVDADFYLPGDKNGMATGEVYSVEGTAFDFRQPKPIGDALSSGDGQIALQRGLDHNFCIRHGGLRRAASVTDPQSGRTLTVYTDMPGVHVYTANNDPAGGGFKGGAVYGENAAVCFETQYYPNSPGNSQFPSCLFRAGSAYASETRFSVSSK